MFDLDPHLLACLEACELKPSARENVHLYNQTVDDERPLTGEPGKKPRTLMDWGLDGLKMALGLIPIGFGGGGMPPPANPGAVVVNGAGQALAGGISLVRLLRGMGRVMRHCIVKIPNRMQVARSTPLRYCIRTVQLVRPRMAATGPRAPCPKRLAKLQDLTRRFLIQALEKLFTRTRKMVNLSSMITL